jgi:iron complex transport system substrate-binding protein
MIATAGGEDAAGRSGAKSHQAEWAALAELRPDVAIVMPCGYYVDDAREQAHAHSHDLAGLGAARAFAVDAASSFSRPGPRLVDGVELLAHLLHPDLAAPPGSVAFAPLGAPAAA